MNTYTATICNEPAEELTLEKLDELVKLMEQNKVHPIIINGQSFFRLDQFGLLSKLVPVSPSITIA